MKVTSSSGISKTIHHNGGHLLLTKRKLLSFEISGKWFFLCCTEISTSLQ